MTSIAPTATSSSGSSSVVSYPVTVSLTGAPTTLRAGMTADITIVTASATNVLTIPAAALRGTTGNYRVQVMGADGTPTVKPVTVGLVTSTTAEIKSGLAEGDTVITGTAADRIASSNSSTTNGFGGGGRNFGGGGVVVNGGGGSGRDRRAADHQPARHQPHVRHGPRDRAGAPRPSTSTSTAGTSSRSSGRPARARAR